MQINNNINTSMDLNPAHPISIKEIVREVNQHGFYSAFCISLMPNMIEHEMLVDAINQLAKRANLKVAFNAAETICVFEKN